MEGRSFSGRERNCCFLNTGNIRFSTISAISGLNFPDDGRCLAVIDWDRDGDLDLWMSNRNAPRVRYMRNDTPTNNHSVTFQLVGNGTTTNRDAIGARIELVLAAPNQTPESQSEVTSAPTSKRIRTLRAGEGFLSQSSKWIHFGTGSTDQIEKVVVHWPAGERQSFDNILVGNRYRLVQGERAAEKIDSNQVANTKTAPPVELPPDSRVARVPLMTRVAMPAVQYMTRDETTTTEAFDEGAPTIVNLWASWCQPCLAELSEFAEREADIKKANLKVISLSVDQAGDQPISTTELAAIVEQLKFPFSWGIVNASTLEQLQQLHDQFFFQRQTLPLPTSFLIDANGRLSVIYRGPVRVDQLLSDLKTLNSEAVSLADQAACFPGRWLQHPRVQETAKEADLQLRYRIAAWLEEIGRDQEAVKHFIDLRTLNPAWDLPHRHLAKIHLRQGDVDQAEESARQAMQANPTNARLHNTMGLIHSRRGDESKAATHFRTAISLDERYAEAHNNLGTSLASQGQTNPAGQHFQRAIEIDGQFAEAHTNLGTVYAAKNNVAKATQHYKIAIEIDPKYVDAYNNLGTMFARGGAFEQAVEYFQIASQLEPNNSEVRRNLNRAQQLMQSQRHQGTR